MPTSYTPLAQQGRLAIHEGDYPGLDSGWINLWNNHGGGDMIRADEVTIEEYRKSPSTFGFSYPTWAGTALLSRAPSSVPVLGWIR